jgi:Ku protein
MSGCALAISILTAGPDERPIARRDVLSGYEVEPDRYVVFNREELKGLRRKTSPTMEIVRSVKLTEIDPVFFETSYYVVPDRGGEKPYAILLRALRETGHVALARVGIYGREHVVIVRPGKYGMLAHTMFYVDEIRSESEFRTNIQSVGAKELDLAKTFLEALAAPFAPEDSKDEYREQLQAMIPKKGGAGGQGGNPRTRPCGEAGGGHLGSTQEEHRDVSETCCLGNAACAENVRQGRGIKSNGPTRKAR